MKPARVRTPDALRPASRLPIAAIALIVVLAACGPATGAPSPRPSTSGAPIGTSTTLPSVEPDATATVAPSDEPVPSDAAGSPAASATGPSGDPDAAAAMCYGSAKTRDFFVAIAEAVDWPVYCAVLPIGWSVEAGSYHLADGGQMVISYKTASGAHLQLQEGHWCTGDAATCAPHDTDVGPAGFADQPGELMTSGGGFALYVSAGQSPSWTATSTGLDEATFRDLCAGLALVGA